ncbi:MAG: hypothetical protein GY848_06000 [Methyloversatilis sp.]|nr:hypothetical protein [Methyloversatilis sp.]
MDERDEISGEAQVRRLMEAAKARYRLESINQAILASKIDESNQTVTNWKKRGIPQDKLLSLSRRLGCQPEYIEFGTLPAQAGDPTTMREPEAQFSITEAQRLLAISDEARAVALGWDQLPETLRSYLKGVVDSALAIAQLKQTSTAARPKQ